MILFKNHLYKSRFDNVHIYLILLLDAIHLLMILYCIFQTIMFRFKILIDIENAENITFYFYFEKLIFSEISLQKLRRWNFTEISKFFVGIPRNSSTRSLMYIESESITFVWEGRIVKYKLCRRTAQCEIASRENSMHLRQRRWVIFARLIDDRELRTNWNRVGGDSYRSSKRRSLRENEARIPWIALYDLLYSTSSVYDAICA